GASASVYWEDGGHQLTQHEAEQAREWYKDAIV
ncbi:carboxylesterase, partial [Bacillus spizizenii]|nr:carboxylesterase [Bacillus spizizenii]